MSGDLFSVQFIRSKTSFLFVPEKWVKKMMDMKKLETDSAIKTVSDSKKSAYFSWQQSNSLQENVIGLNATVATNLGIKESDLMSLVICNSPPGIYRIEMSPISADDLEMIEQSSSLLQSTLLNQVQVVWESQLLTAWISNSLPIVLHVGAMEPSVCVGRLQQLTEVVILDPISSQVLPTKNSDLGDSSIINDIMSSGRSLASTVLNAVQAETGPEEEKNDSCFVAPREQYIFRVYPLSGEIPQHGPLDAFLSSSSFSKCFYLNSRKPKRLFCKILKVPSPRDSDSVRLKKSNPSNAGDKTLHSTEKLPTNLELSSYISLLNADMLYEGKKDYYRLNGDCLYLSNNLRNSLHLEIGARVILSDFKLKIPPERLDEVELLPYHGLEFRGLGKSLIQYIQKMPDGLLLCNKMLLTIPSEKGFIDAYVQLIPSSITHIIVKSHQLDERKVRVTLKRTAEKHQATSSDRSTYLPSNITEDLHFQHFQNIIDEGVLSLKLTLGLHEFDTEGPIRINNNVLLLGKRGSGKTSSARVLCSLLQGPPYFVHSILIKCRPLKGKTVESLYKQFQSHIDDCVYHQPSIFVLDDLDCIAGVSEDQDQDSQRSAYYNRVGRMILQLLSCLQSRHAVAIVATASSTSSLSSTLIPPRGIHFLSTRLELPELSKADRQNILEKLFNKKVKNKQLREIKCFETMKECAKKTEGYCCQDLADLVDKATLAACMRQVLSSKLPVLESSDINDALSETTPMLLRGVSLHKDFAFGWDDVGGLTDVKKELKEVFEWPVMYPELFQNSPLRQQSGLLLYGAPGTGKTMLAGAVARECGLNFISVKGPELLSKYIGASEEAVRNVFFKAQSAKPCVLFFDEFDSLAPRRGHDNTGVTDRVVNQLLTQLDGVESLVGVWVLAATSRPDLLDPALLRPGRLDRSVLCPLPDEESRLAILHALSRKMNLDSHVDFKQIAAESEGFTGADLQSMLYSAQLNAVDEQQLQINDDSTSQPEKQVHFRVVQDHLDAAFQNTRPSLTVEERAKYLYIYSKFGRSRKETVIDPVVNSQRATLA